VYIFFICIYLLVNGQYCPITLGIFECELMGTLLSASAYNVNT